MMASSSSLKEANNVFKIIIYKKKTVKLNILYDGLLQFTKRGNNVLKIIKNTKVI